MQLPNIIGFIFGMTQMTLYIIYKDSKKKGQDHNGAKEADIKLEGPVMGTNLGNTEKIGHNDINDFDEENNP